MVLQFYETSCLREELQSAEGLIEEGTAVRIVGEERDRAVLFTWSGNRRSPRSRSQGETVAFVGIREAGVACCQLQVLFEHYEDAVIVGASVNAARSLLGFTTVAEPAQEYSQAGLGDKIYSSYVAEISPQGRCFALDVDRTHYQRVQFLYVATSGKRATTESHMLFMLHGENIGLYTFSLSHPPGSESGMALQSSPRVSEVCKAFHWYQWDAEHQRLYVVCFKPKQPEGLLEPAILSFEFLHDKPLTVMDLALPLSLREDQAVNRPLYLDLPGFLTLQEEHMNLKVVNLPGVANCGSLFLCYQHPLELDNELEVAHSHRSQKMKIAYSICMLHHGRILKSQMKGCVHREENSRLFFSSLNDYVVVFLSGVVLHLLNCSAEHAPVHHILLHDVGVPRFPCAPKMTHTVHFCQWQGCASVLDTATLKGYQIRFDRSALAHVFTETHLTATKLAILHMALVHLNDTQLVKMLLRELCLDSTHPDCSVLLSDYLIGSTYAHLKFKVVNPSDSGVLKLLPLTESDRFRGHLEMDRHGREVARITYVLLPDVEEGLAKSDSSDLSQGKGVVQLKAYPEHTNPFAALLDNLRLNKQPTPRFSLKSFSADLMEKNAEGAAGPDEGEEAPKRSIFRRISGSFRFRSASRSRQHAHKPLPFLEHGGEHDPREDRRRKLLMQSLRSHLVQRKMGNVTGSPDKQDKWGKLAQDYAGAQVEQSENLLQTVWTLLGYDSENHPAKTSLNVRGSARDCALFHLAECFYSSLEQWGFPFPSGFQLFFTCIGFRCLQPQLFLQYVNHHIFYLSQEFLHRLIHELGHDPSSTELKFQILWRLNPSVSSSLLAQCVQVGHEEASSFLSQERVSKLLTEGEADVSGASARTQEVHTTPEYEMSSGQMEYMPLVYLMQYLRSRERRMADVSPKAGELEHVSLNFVEDDCLRSFKSVIGRLT